MKKAKNQRLTKGARSGSWRNGKIADEQLESMVSQLLDPEPGLGGESTADVARADLLAARNGGSNVAGRTLREEEIESLLERMVFSEQAFLKYSH